MTRLIATLCILGAERPQIHVGCTVTIGDDVPGTAIVLQYQEGSCIVYSESLHKKITPALHTIISTSEVHF